MQELANKLPYLTVRKRLAPHVYHKCVARQFTSLLLASLLLAATGCDRGSRPKNLGKPAPDFTVTDSTHTVSLHNYIGKVVVLNFWATWCPPCVEEMPALMRMQNDLGSKVTVLAVSTDDNERAYQQFLSDRHINLLTVRDGEQVSNRAYGTERFPETYIIDKQGRIRRKLIGAAKWDSPEIEKYLRDLAAE
jgi:cytochrome c biogenesis protein CcmG, thiol:disulfide interchange protein DsbE